MKFQDQILFRPEGGIDSDSTARAVANGDYRMFDYCRLGQVSGQGFTVVTSKGTIEINNPDIGEFDEIVGTGVWQKQYSIVYLLYKFNADDEIWQYDINTQTNILICATNAFNFQWFSFFYHVDIIDDIMKFTDGWWNGVQWVNGVRYFNPPYQINLQKAKDGDYPVIDLQVIDAIKWPPLPPTCVYASDPNRADNKLRRKLFRFRVQYIYENSEETAWSLWSNLALPSQSEFISGSNWPDSSADNRLDVTFDTGPNVVKKINLAVQIYSENTGGAETEFGLFYQLDKSDPNVVISDNSTFTYQFFGNVSTKPISNASKNYDRLPLTAKCQTAIENTRLTYSNFREGYDKIEIDIRTDYLLNEISWSPTETALVYSAILADYGGDYYNFIKLDGTSLLFQVGAFYYASITLNSGETVQLRFEITQEIYDACIADVSPINKLFEFIATDFSDEINAVVGSTLVAPYAPDSTPYMEPYWTIWDGVAYPDASTPWIVAFSAITVFAQRQTLSTPSLKVGATHQFGIVYGDRAQRDSTVLTNDYLNVFVPWYSDIDTSGFTDPNNPFTVQAQLQINNLPPIWATRYWIVARKATEIADFSQWVINANYNNSAITPDTQDRYWIDLDRLYISVNTGATINHTPQKGDIARFIRTRLEDVTNPSPSPYIGTFFELEVMEYQPAGGNSNRPRILVENFDLTLIDPDRWTGQCIEIYTPRPVLDTDGNLFVAKWRDVSEAIEIIDPYTDDRRHAGSFELGGNVTGSNIDDRWWLEGDQTGVLSIGDVISVISEGITYTGIIEDVSGYNFPFNITRVLLSASARPPADDLTGTWYVRTDQIVVNGVSTVEAILNLRLR
jgi:hypothetical protein